MCNNIIIYVLLWHFLSCSSHTKRKLNMYDMFMQKLSSGFVLFYSLMQISTYSTKGPYFPIRYTNLLYYYTVRHRVQYRTNTIPSRKNDFCSGPMCQANSIDYLYEGYSIVYFYDLWEPSRHFLVRKNFLNKKRYFLTFLGIR